MELTTFLPELLTIAGVHMLAVMSPGPDFAMIVKNSLSYSRKAGIWTAVGLGLGIMVHATYSLIGIGLLISQSIVLFNIIKWLGALYLIWIGMQALRSKKQVPSDELEGNERSEEIRPISAIQIGFLTNVLNPKATLFFLSLFSVVVSAETPTIVKAIYGIEMTIATIAWFAFVATILTFPQFKAIFKKFQHWFERVMGALLIALGIKILSSE